MAKRVFELARELGVTSKVVLVKCRAEGLEIKNHMSAMSAGLEATIREWFSDSAAGSTAVETAEHVDLTTARKEASKRRRKAKKAEADQLADTSEPAPAPADAPGQPAAATDEPVEPAPPVEAAAEPPADVAAESPVETEVDTEVETETKAETEVEDQPGPRQADKAKARPKAMKKRAAKQEPPAGKQPEPKPEPITIKPAGPQVVPKPAVLKGPRVVRVEKPDIIQSPRSRPRPRPRPSAMQGALSDAGVKVPGPTTDRRPKTGFVAAGAGAGTGDAARRKTKKRSPRRRGGRTADSGERLKEWRSQDLAERSQRLAAAGGGLRRRRPSVSGRKAFNTSNIKTGKVEIDAPITIKKLSAVTGVKVAEIIKHLMAMGVMATANQVIESAVAESIMVDYDVELVVTAAKSPLDDVIEKLQTRSREKLHPRPPVVTFLGHVDHGKTSLMDRIRHTGIAAGEAGGITQHIGAYRLERDEASDVVFLDTPGHEAFTAMRARGANMTDVVVLVIAADDGVMPQTVEAINHAKAANVPIVVALNKIDLPNANVQRALGQLAEHGLSPREWGGDVEVIHTSAETGEGVDALVETLSLEAELLELQAELDAPAEGYVIESEMNVGLGATARLLVLNGTLKVGDMLLAGRGYGRVRAIRSDHGKNLKQASPGTPVEVAGLDEIPEAGDKFYVVEDIECARAAAEHVRRDARAKGLATPPKQDLESLLSQIEAGQANELAIVVKADVQGSIEAITGAIAKLGTDETHVKILHAGVGGISTGDVTLAEASGAIIIGFNVVAGQAARQLAKDKGVDVRLYRVIYDIIDDMRTALEEGLAPEIREESLGRAEVRQVFKISRVGTVVGCLATDGVVQRNAKVRIVRDNVVIEDGRYLESLKRFKDDAREVRAGLECGMKIAGYNDLKEGDVLEFYREVSVARTLQESR